MLILYFHGKSFHSTLENREKRESLAQWIFPSLQYKDSQSAICIAQKLLNTTATSFCLRKGVQQYHCVTVCAEIFTFRYANRIFMIILLWITYSQLFSIFVLVLAHGSAKYIAMYFIILRTEGQVLCLAKHCFTENQYPRSSW